MRSLAAFPHYSQLPTKVPKPLWPVARAVSVGSLIALCVALVKRPAGGLFLLWQIMVPLLPMLFFLAPGLWRNICPLAAANQAPRRFGFTRALSAPAWFREHTYLMAITAFLFIAASRKVIFNNSGPATAALLLACLAGAFAGGVLLKGKSGWCSSVCPLLPVQRLYGQTPFVTVPDSRCAPCVGCTKNCYDFNPTVAYLADMHDNDPGWGAPRKLFAGAFPGFILAFFTVPSPPAVGVANMYVRIGAFVLVSTGSFFVLDTFLAETATAKITALYGASAFNLFYWYNSLTLTRAFHQVTGISFDGMVWLLRTFSLAVTVAWVARTFRTEARFTGQSIAVAGPAKMAPRAARALRVEGDADQPKVRFAPGDYFVEVEAGTTLLEAAERDGQRIEAGCRIGMCGSDPVCIVVGMDRLSEPDGDETSTLRRLGLGANTRMACAARVLGTVEASLTATPGGLEDEAAPIAFDVSIRSVVIIGNGIAGVTAAEDVRRRHPDCAIHVVGREAHVLYNRMGISRLIHGRSAMQGLYLLAEQWYDEHGITAWLNTHATQIDLEKRAVVLGTREVLTFDRLILAMGSAGFVPKIAGFGRPGTFLLREASDAIDIRAYAQEHGAQTAIVAGGGLLGLEAARALHDLGLGVQVVNRSGRVLSKQVDMRSGQMVAEYLGRLGIAMVYEADIESLPGEGPVEQVRLKDGRILTCDMLLVCAGIRPNADLAKAAGLEVNQGVIVDDHMRASAAGVFAAGDVAEVHGQVVGLWPAAVRQAETAAANALGSDTAIEPDLPVAILKGVGLELTSVGRIHPEGDDESIVVEDAERFSYRKLVLSDRKAVGAVIVGNPNDARLAVAAVKCHAEVPEGFRQRLRQGDWQVLKDVGHQQHPRSPSERPTSHRPA